MTSSRSKASRNSWLALVALILLAGIANAGGRKRIVVLDFDGPKAEKFHDDVVKLIKKSHTVVAVDKWNGAAEELDAAKVTEKNVKKIAKKLKIDGVVSGKIEKRRDEYIVQLKLRAGTSGELVGNRIDAKADGPRLDGKAQREVKDELIGAIDELEANHGGGSADEDDADAKPAKKKKASDEGDDEGDQTEKHGKFSKKKSVDEDAGDDEKPAKPEKKDDKKTAKKDDKKKKAADEDAGDDEKPAKPDKKDDKKVAKKDDKKKSDDDTAAALSTKHDEDDTPKTKKDDAKKDKDDGDGDEDATPKKKKRVAKKSKDDEDGGGGGGEDGGSVSEGGEVMTKAAALTPANRAVDFVIGMSFTARRLSFTADADLGDPPPSYKQSVPVAGGIMDAVVYPMAFSHKNTGIITGLGIEVMYDKVIKISSSKKYIDTMMNEQTASLSTVEDRFSIGAVLRYPVSPVLVLGGKIHYSSQQFNIEQTLPNGSPTDIPNVHYSMIEPKFFVKYSLGGPIIINAEAGFMAVTNTGGIQASNMTGYGPASVYGFELQAGLDYHLTGNIFVRILAKVEQIKLSFKGDPNSLANTRDTDPMQDVQGASDTYFGGMGTIGYAF